MNKPVDVNVKAFHGGCPHGWPGTCSLMLENGSSKPPICSSASE